MFAVFWPGLTVEGAPYLPSFPLNNLTQIGPVLRRSRSMLPRLGAEEERSATPRVLNGKPEVRPTLTLTPLGGKKGPSDAVTGRPVPSEIFPARQSALF